MLDLQSKGFCIFGLPDSGKSTLANKILSEYGPGAFIYDTLAEYADEPYDSYIPDNRYDATELELVTRNILASRRYSLFVIDGKNDVRYLNDLKDGLGDAVTNLAPYHFVLYHKGADFELYSPVSEMFTTDKKLKT